MGERRRETEKEREKGDRSETDVPKLYTYNEYELSVIGFHCRGFNKYYQKLLSFQFDRNKTCFLESKLL